MGKDGGESRRCVDYYWLIIADYHQISVLVLVVVIRQTPHRHAVLFGTGVVAVV